MVREFSVKWSLLRQECDILESSTLEETCSVVPTSLPTRTQCDYDVVETPRSMCTEVEMVMFQEVCEEVPRMVPKVECDIQMKEIELKEICVDIDIQLPREECSSKEKEQCRFEPREVIVQKCDPTVKEVCNPRSRPVCVEKCTEECSMTDKQVCMRIPQQVRPVL